MQRETFEQYLPEIKWCISLALRSAIALQIIMRFGILFEKKEKKKKKRFQIEKKTEKHS